MKRKGHRVEPKAAGGDRGAKPRTQEEMLRLVQPRQEKAL